MTYCASEIMPNCWNTSSFIVQSDPKKAHRNVWLINAQNAAAFSPGIALNVRKINYLRLRLKILLIIGANL